MSEVDPKRAPSSVPGSSPPGRPAALPHRSFAVRSQPGSADVFVFSHLRWDFVFQRPQHLLTRCAAKRRVFFIEEPIAEDRVDVHAEIGPRTPGVVVARLRVPRGMEAGRQLDAQRRLISRLANEHGVGRFLTWYYTPMALEFTRHLAADLVIYDCMDELSNFAGAPRGLREREEELFRRAHLVFCGGQSLYEAKRPAHRNIHAIPSSIDAAHFGRARRALPEPEDQRVIPGPRLGFFGVLDERFDRDLVDAVARARPDWHLVFIGPVVKIDPASLPQRPNVHYLGPRPYADLPGYLAHWDVALMPFAINDATRFISPTKTPEYLAAGRPVVSTPIRDVVRPYGELGLVRIADEPEAFVAACEEALRPPDPAWLHDVDAFLARTSWDRTWARMSALVDDALRLAAPSRARGTSRDAARDAAAAD